ncbi:33780_t:CDS:2, partial [Gigaspora margarita]
KTSRTYKNSELKRQLDPGGSHYRNRIDLGPVTWNQEEMNGLTRMGPAEPKEASNTSCYQNGISLKKNEMLKGPVKNDDSNSQFGLVELCCQYEIGHGKLYKD